jgi:hypothetical protein
VGWTLLSAAFDHDLGQRTSENCHFLPRACPMGGEGQDESKVKSGGQECPPHMCLVYSF